MLQEHGLTTTLLAIQIAPKGRCGAATSTYVDGPSSTQVDVQLAGSSNATSVAKLGGAHTMKRPADACRVLGKDRSRQSGSLPQSPPHGQRRPQCPMPGDPEGRQQARQSRGPARSSILISCREQAQYLLRRQQSIGSPATVALRNPTFSRSSNQAMSNQHFVAYEYDKRAQRDLGRQGDNFDFTFDRQRGAHAGAAQRETKNAFFVQRFPQQREPRGCESRAHPLTGAQVRHSFTAAATCATCPSVRVSPDGR